MNIRRTLKLAEKALGDNSPLILTAIGVAGTVTTAVFASRASYIAAGVIADEQERRFMAATPKPADEITPRERFDLLWKLYIPAVGVGSTTIVCIILANRIGTRRTAAVAAAYTISEKAFVEYKDKVVEKIGENQERAVRDELAQDRVNAHPVAERTVIIAGGSGLKVMCYDAYSDRYFMSNMELLRKAENDINKQIHHHDSATLSNFYSNVGLPKTSASDEMGWNTDRWLELNFSTVMTEDEQTPCIAFDFPTIPIRDPWFLP